MNRNIFKSIGAVLAGMVFIGITHTLVDKILEGTGILPKDNLYVGTGLILIVIGYRAILSVAGCYLTARLAPRKPMAHALTLGAIGTLASIGGVVANAQYHLGPDWYAWALVIIALPLSWLGGKLYLRQKSRNSQEFAVRGQTQD